MNNSNTMKKLSTIFAEPVEYLVCNYDIMTPKSSHDFEGFHFVNSLLKFIVGCKILILDMHKNARLKTKNVLIVLEPS